MIAKQILDDISEKLTQAFNSSPVKDMEKNVKAVLSASFARMDLVSKEDYNIQQAMLLRVCEELQVLQQRVDELENQLAKKDASTPLDHLA